QVDAVVLQARVECARLIERSGDLNLDVTVTRTRHRRAAGVGAAAPVGQSAAYRCERAEIVDAPARERRCVEFGDQTVRTASRGTTFTLGAVLPPLRQCRIGT